MERQVIFHRLVQRDMDGILRYYREEASLSVAERFFETFLLFVEKALANPKGFHPASEELRRANLPGFRTISSIGRCLTESGCWS